MNAPTEHASLTRLTRIAMCLDVKPVDWAEARRLVTESYRLVAPKTLAGSCR